MLQLIILLTLLILIIYNIEAAGPVWRRPRRPPRRSPSPRKRTPRKGGRSCRLALNYGADTELQVVV